MIFLTCVEKDAATQQFRKLIRSLAEIHLDAEVRANDDDSIFVFVRAKTDQTFADVVYRSRIRDWLHGVRQIQPVRETVDTLTGGPLSEAERLRVIHDLITAQRADGGAGITPKHGEWKFVEAIFPLHDHERNKKWLSQWAKKTFLTPQDLDDVRDAVGEKVSTVVDVRFVADLCRLHTTTPSSSPTSSSSSALPRSVQLCGCSLATLAPSTWSLLACGL